MIVVGSITRQTTANWDRLMVNLRASVNFSAVAFKINTTITTTTTTV